MIKYDSMCMQYIFPEWAVEEGEVDLEVHPGLVAEVVVEEEVEVVLWMVELEKNMDNQERGYVNQTGILLD